MRCHAHLFSQWPAHLRLILLLVTPTSLLAAETRPALTTLTNPDIRYSVPDKAYAVLRAGDIEAVIVNNEAVDDEVLPGHRAGYSGVARLSHRKRPENLFVPSYAGLNYEHIHDGKTRDRKILFEPRNAPMELRKINDRTVELYQAPSPHYGLESCLRYAILDDGTLEMTLECIPTRDSFENGYVGLFWASYIHQPESLDIHFQGFTPPHKSVGWIRGVTPAHGKLSTHLGRGDNQSFDHDDDFPLTLVFHRSRHRYQQPWYFGVSHKMAFVQIFRPVDKVRLSQSPSGGGTGNPAWDFQYFVPRYKVGRCSQMVMRAMYIPYESPQQVLEASAVHRRALGIDSTPQRK